MKHSFVSLAILGLAGCSVMVGQDSKMNGKLNSTDAQFVREALASGNHEIEMGQMALKQSNDPQVRSLAQRLVNDHSAAGKKLEEIAGSAAPTAPGTVPATTADIKNDVKNRQSDALITQDSNLAEQPVRATGVQSNASESAAAEARKDVNSHNDTGRHMESMQGASFDKAWAKQMVEDHKAAITKFEAEQKLAENADLQRFISATLSTLMEHLTQAQALDK